MFEEARLKWQTHAFTLDGRPIDLETIGRVRLDLSLGSTLQWEPIFGDGDILFELDFGFGPGFSSMEDMTPFLSLGLGIDAFAKYIDARAIGAIMLFGDAYFSPIVAWDEELQNDLRLFFRELGLDEPKTILGLSGKERLALEVFARDTVMGYASLLASQLPPGLAGLIDIRGSGLTPFQEEVLFLPSTLAGMAQVRGGQKLEPRTSILIPELTSSFLELMPRFEAAAKKLRALGIPYRCVSAEQFHENWELLDTAIGLPELMSQSALRQRDGFLAAGGEWVTLSGGEGLDFESFVVKAADELKTKAKALRDLNRQKS